MFRLLQGDVGSENNCCLNCFSKCYFKWFSGLFNGTNRDTARQHYNLANKLFDKNINIKILTSKTEYSERKEILKI